ncbi:uncharacterized protein LOC126565651 [Anopheles maculipalpis]|uniref:uncharacterized protein LOC126565651 n=1 Tax=Anopheles maculipalpis TaxID=1496333 RepID=UPI002158F905|nr:uncharacterized protein LOC126565651 [Anopheles maculipalpis]
MSLDWKRDATELLIKAYKKYPVLYDMRHPRYYNKSVRGNALQEIVSDVRQLQPETTMKDVVRKIQTLRTQFGQELTKIRRHAQNGSEYRPTVWWYQGLIFLQHHIKPRSVGSCSINLSQGDIDGWKQEPDDNSSTFNVSIVRNGSSASPSELHGGDSEHSEEEIEYETEVHYEINSIDMKDMKALELRPCLPVASSGLKRENRFPDRKFDDRKVARMTTADADDQQSHKNPLSPTPPPSASSVEHSDEVVVPEQSTASGMVADLKPPKALANSSRDERHRSLGHFVGSQMACLKDDYIYYETQSEILNIMTRGILRQLASDKRNSTKADQESGKEK